MEADNSKILQEAQIATFSTHTQQLPRLLRLPLEVRHKIYGHVLRHSMTPTPEEIYLVEGPTTRLPPIPLYFVNRQIHDELSTILPKFTGLLTIHVTPNGAIYSSFSETIILAGRSRNITRASKLLISIWPPHPDRPADIFEIWRFARALQRRLIQAAPLESLWLRFNNNDLASWCPNGTKILDTLWPDDRPEAKEGKDTGFNDVTGLAELFARVRIASGGYCLAPELRRPSAFRETSLELDFILDMMLGEEAIPEHYHNETTLADKIRYDRMPNYKFREVEQQEQGARIAIEKLNKITCDGKKKMSVGDWYRYLEIWNPHFEMLETGTSKAIGPWRERFCRR